MAQEQLDKSRVEYEANHDKHHVDNNFQVGYQAQLYINNEIIPREGKNINPIRDGPFKILENIGNNAFQLDFQPYMKIYGVVNMENLILYEPPLI